MLASSPCPTPLSHRFSTTLRPIARACCPTSASLPRDVASSSFFVSRRGCWYYLSRSNIALPYRVIPQKEVQYVGFPLCFSHLPVIHLPKNDISPWLTLPSAPLSPGHIITCDHNTFLPRYLSTFIFFWLHWRSCPLLSRFFLFLKDSLGIAA